MAVWPLWPCVAGPGPQHLLCSVVLWKDTLGLLVGPCYVGPRRSLDVPRGWGDPQMRQQQGLGAPGLGRCYSLSPGHLAGGCPHAGTCEGAAC